MLTRLKVSGFKNLVDVDVRFGPFTCIAGANGVGKSNLFDAIRFLAALADKPLLEAALSVRTEGGRASDVRDLFHRVGEDAAPRMRFEADMVAPPKAVDDYGQVGSSRATLLRYTLELGYRRDEATSATVGPLVILSEHLRPFSPGSLAFNHGPEWPQEPERGGARGPFITTTVMVDEPELHLHRAWEGLSPASFRAASLPRTLVGRGEARAHPEVLSARREMASWTVMQLEPEALRKPAELTAATDLAADGANLPAALHYLARSATQGDADAVYCQVSNRLSELLGGVGSVRVERDEKRGLLTLMLRDLGGTELPARSLSDGTLRFLALSTLELDWRRRGAICLEEPENGIHPDRIPAMVRLLRDIAVDPDEPDGDDNPLRQVIVNTHSPVVVAAVPDDSLLVADLVPSRAQGKRFSHAQFACLPATWRAMVSDPPPIMSRGQLLAYLNPVPPVEPGELTHRVVDREDLQALLPYGGQP